MVQVLSRRPVTVDDPGSTANQSVWVLWCINWHSEKVFFSTNTAVFPCQYHTTSAPYSSLPACWYFRRTNGRNLWTFQEKQCSLWYLGEHWTGNYVCLFLLSRAKSSAELNCVADGFCVICNVQVGSSGEPPDLWSGDTRFESGL